MKRYVAPLALSIVVGIAMAESHGRILWVKYDAETREASLSNGEPLTQRIPPGQFVSVGGEGVRARREWRPPQDIEKRYTPPRDGRVVFSHERHFAALGAKDCKACHAEQKGLGSGKPFLSFAASPAAEPHGEKSEGRFCANCHKDNTKSGAIEGAKPPVSVELFSAVGKAGDASCAHCHTPADHGLDFTGGHGDRAEHGAARCVECHRGATSITPAELAQATHFRAAQATLIQTPDDKAAFEHTLPNNFCAYCHSLDGKPWKGEGSEGERGRGELRERRGDDD